MGIDDSEPKPASAWNWPAEWAVERAFWREVGTRTIAGVFTIIIVGTPALIWAGLSRVLTWDTVAPILIGLGMFLGALVLYLVLLVVIRAVARRRSRKVLIDSDPEEYKDVSTRDLDIIVMEFADGQTIKVPYTINRKAQEGLKRVATWKRVGALGSLIAPILAAVAILSALYSR